MIFSDRIKSITFFLLFSITAISGSKRNKIAEPKIVLPSEVVQYMTGYTDPETFQKMLNLSSSMQNININELIDRIAIQNIKDGHYGIPVLNIPVHFDQSSTRSNLYYSYWLSLVSKYYDSLRITVKDEKITETFKKNYANSFLKYINLFLNSDGFFKLVFNKNKDTTRFLEENFGIIFSRKLVGINYGFKNEDVEEIVVEIKNLNTKYTFLFANTFETILQLCNSFDFSSKNMNDIVKVIIGESWRSIKDRNLDIFQNKKDNLIQLVDKNNISLLSAACGLKNLEFVKFLLEKDASWHPDIYGNGPLHYAVDFNPTGKSINSRLNLGLTKIEFFENTIEIIKLLLSKEVLFARNINRKNIDNDTPLHIAAKSNFITIDIGEDEEVMDASTLTFINSHGNSTDNNIYIINIVPDIITFLMTHGANPNSVNKDGDTALNRACLISDGEPLIAPLLENGANPNIPNNEGETPLARALEEGLRLDTLQLLLGHNANPNVYNTKRIITPLRNILFRYVNGSPHAKNYLYSLAQILISYGADPFKPSFGTNIISHMTNQIDSLMISAYDYAEQKKLPEFITLFETKFKGPSLQNTINDEGIITQEELQAQQDKEEFQSMGLFELN